MSYYYFRRLEKEDRDKDHCIAPAFLLVLIPSITASIMAVVICREHKLNINAVSQDLTIHLGYLPLIFVVLVCGRAEPRLGNCLSAMRICYSIL